MKSAAVIINCALAFGAGAVELSGDLSLELRGFPQEALDERQQDANISIALQPEFYGDWQRGLHSYAVQPFFRLDAADSERTHFDLRRAYYLYAGRDFEWRIGVDRVFWGVTESQHLIDIINQTDLVENIDGEDRLGQPMLSLRWIQDGGWLDLYLLAGFRERSFAGVDGRFRAPLPIAEDARYESDAEEKHVDFAARWFRSMGSLDLGIGHFHGTSREPTLLFEVDAGGARLVPYYPQIDQTSLDAQLVAGGFLFKLEAMLRADGQKTAGAAVGGFEYSLVGVGGTSSDLGLLAEYHALDSRLRGGNPFDNDLFVGARLTLNDVQSTAILAGAIIDVESATDEILWNVEASRRVGDRYLLSLELRSVRSTPADPADADLRAFRNDDVIQLELARFF